MGCAFSSLFAGTCGETKRPHLPSLRLCALSVPSLQGHVVKQHLPVAAGLVRAPFSSLFAGTCGETSPPGP